MKKRTGLLISIAVFAVVALIACGGENKKAEENKTTAPKSMVAAALTKDQKLEKGKVVYEKVCKACHQADGKGVENAFPPLAKSDYLAADIKRAMHGVANGLKGEITVNGKKFKGEMPKPSPAFTDEELASVMTYVLNNFGNAGGEVSVEEAREARK